MKTRFFTLMLSVVALLACSSDPIVNDEVNLAQEETVQKTSKINPKPRPFKLKAKGYYGAFVPNNESCSDVLALDAHTDGNASQLGRISQNENWCWNGTQGDLGTRSITIIAANGNELYCTPVSVVWSSNLMFEEEVVIDGGTGRFENATGSFIQKVVISREDVPSGDNVVSGTYSLSGSGTVAY
jgi:hypothetical protein